MRLLSRRETDLIAEVDQRISDMQTLPAENVANMTFSSNEIC